ncbi:hypothetical protein MR657_07315, partial [bacterium]|nr:hypothetical protein [bacterium]
AERRPPFAALGGQDPARLFAALPTPCYLLDEGALRRNGELLAGVAERPGCGGSTWAVGTTSPAPATTCPGWNGA